MTRVFISYRRDDASLYAGLLSEELVERLGSTHVFRDVEVIEPGDRFPQSIDSAVPDCDVLIALIGPMWLSAEKAGRRRLDDPADYVRLEIAAALNRGIRVVPVLVRRRENAHATRVAGDPESTRTS